MLVGILLKLASIMIVMLSAMLNLVGKILPDVAIDALREIISAVYVLDFFFPVQTLFTVLSFMMLFEMSMLTKTMIVSIINWVRGAGELKV